MKKTHRIERLVLGGAEDQEKHPDVWTPVERCEGSEEWCLGYLRCLKMSGGRDDNMRVVEIPPPKTVMSVSNADLEFIHTVLGRCLDGVASLSEIRAAMGRVGEAPAPPGATGSFDS